MSSTLEVNVLNIVDKYKEHFTDIDYKEICDLLMNSHIKNEKIEESDDEETENDEESGFEMNYNDIFFKTFMKYHFYYKEDEEDASEYVFNYLDKFVMDTNIDCLKKLVEQNGGMIKCINYIISDYGDNMIKFEDENLAIRQISMMTLKNVFEDKLQELNLL